MKNKIVFFGLLSLVLCNSLNLLAQDVHGVFYKMTLNENKNPNEESYNIVVPNFKNKINEITFELRFDKFLSQFIAINSNLSNNDFEFALTVADMRGTIYRKNNDNLFYEEVKSYGTNQKNFIAAKTKYTDWEITQEKKIILGYECFKATCVLMVDYGDNDINTLYPLTAWYCPDLKYSYGPKCFGNLPGLIMELENNLVVFKALKLNFEKNNVNSISIPKEKTIIPEAKMYDNIERE
jgi:GLPGLI family protein